MSDKPDWLEPMGESQVNPGAMDIDGPLVLGDSSGRRAGDRRGFRCLARMGCEDEFDAREKRERDEWHRKHPMWECLKCGWFGCIETTGCPRCQAHADEMVIWKYPLKKNDS